MMKRVIAIIMAMGLSSGCTIRKAKYFARCDEIKYAHRKMIIYSIHIPFKAARKVIFVKLPVANTVL